MSSTEEETATPPARTRRTRAQIEADRAALQAAHDSDTIPTDGFIKILQEWQRRYTACEDAERNLQRCGLKFTRVYDYERRCFTTKDDRFANVSADSLTELSKIKVIRSIKTLKRSYGATAYGLNWLEGQLEKQYGLTVKQYNDKYTLTWTMEVTANQLNEWDWSGAETSEEIGNLVRNYLGIDWRNSTLSTIPDPARAVDAAARDAAKTAAEAKETAEAVTETVVEADVAESLLRAEADIRDQLNRHLDHSGTGTQPF